MGVDYTAFSCYGVRVDVEGDAYAYEEQLAKHGLELFEFGSRQYGGGFGYVLGFKSTYAAVDFEGETLARQLPDIASKTLASFANTGDPAQGIVPRGIVPLGDPGWFVCGWVS